MYELSNVNSQRVVASGDDIRPLLDAAVLGAVRFGHAYRIHACWAVRAPSPIAGHAMRKLRYGIEPNGEVWDIDGSGVPATFAGNAALYINGAYTEGERNRADVARHYSKAV